MTYTVCHKCVKTSAKVLCVEGSRSMSLSWIPSWMRASTHGSVCVCVQAHTGQYVSACQHTQVSMCLRASTHRSVCVYLVFFLFLLNDPVTDE